MIRFKRNTLTHILIFWERHPALSYGLTLTLTSLAALKTPYFSLLLLPLFIGADAKKTVRLLLLIALSLPLFLIFFSFPKTVMEGSGDFSIEHIYPARRSGWMYRGKLSSFTSQEGKRWRGAPLACTLYASELYPLDHIYHVSGVLRPLPSGYFSLKAKEAWEPLQHTFSLTPWRLRAKKEVRAYLEREIKDPRAAEFLGGLATGELHDRTLLKELGHLGLAHLMAISGLHFALVSLFLHVFLRSFLSQKISALLLLILLSGYFLFIGNTPSIQRAWLIVTLYLVGQLVERRVNGLNSLGVALFFAVVLNPRTVLSLGFQLSFLAAGGILLLYHPLEMTLRGLFVKRPLRVVMGRSLLYQHFYLASAFLREALALTLAVHLALFPLLLSYFHSFPLHSLLYNLFFPFLVTLSMLLLLMGATLHPLIPFLGKGIHLFNTTYTSWILKITESPPLPLKTLYVEYIPGTLVVGYLVLLFWGGIYWIYRE